MTSQAKQIKLYRKVVSDAWLPIVGRRRLNSRDYELISEFFKSGFPVDAVLNAIKKCSERAQRNSYVIYSLGVIRRDLEVVMKEKSKIQVGAANPDEDAWRERWREDLTELIAMVDEPYQSAYKTLLADLESLSLAQAHQRWQAIQQMK